MMIPPGELIRVYRRGDGRRLSRVRFNVTSARIITITTSYILPPRSYRYCNTLESYTRC